MVHGIELLVVTAIGGYWVLERAETHKGQLRSVGRLLGVLVIVASLIGAVSRVWCVASSVGYCPFGKAGKMDGFSRQHPFSSGNEPPSQ